MLNVTLSAKALEGRGGGSGEESATASCRSSFSPASSGPEIGHILCSDVCRFPQRVKPAFSRENRPATRDDAENARCLALV